MSRRRITLAVVAACALPSVLSAQAAARATPHLNPLVDLLKGGKPIFGLYAPANPRPRPGTQAPTEPAKSTAELARMALAYDKADYVFDGSMEGDFDRGFASFSPFARELWTQGRRATSASPLRLPMVVKMHEIAPDPARAARHIAQQLDLGVSTVVFVDVESADEVRQGIAAMRYARHGGTRPEGTGEAAQRWGLSDDEYRDRADVWPLNPKGELLNWTIVESKAGLARVREIAAVPGIGVLFPGAGTLRQVFTTTDASGKRQFDAEGWEAAIQQVLATCKEFRIACGYPAREDDIEVRMKQGFSVFVIGWGEPGFRTVELGRKLAGR